MNNIKIEKCCDIGDFSCQVPMAIRGRTVYIDYCISDIVSALNANGIETRASCCGHEKIDGRISLEDGRDIILKNVKNKTKR